MLIVNQRRPPPSCPNVILITAQLHHVGHLQQFPPIPPPISLSFLQPYIQRNSQLFGIFCPFATEQLEYHSPYVCIHMCSCFCVLSICMSQSINIPQLFLLTLHNRPLCLHKWDLLVQLLRVCVCMCVSVLACWWQCINSDHLFLLEEHYDSLC